MEKKHVISEEWIVCGHLGLRIPPNTEGDVVRPGTCKDYAIKFRGFEKWTLECNLGEVSVISPVTN